MPQLQDYLPAFLGSDPIAGDDAVDSLAAFGVDAFKAMLPMGARPPGLPPFTEQGIWRLGQLYTKVGDAALPYLVEVLQEGDWGYKQLAVACLRERPFDWANTQAEKGAEQVAKLLDPCRNSMDAVRSAMQALGSMGAHTWAKEVVERCPVRRPGQYDAEKLTAYVLESLLRMAVRTKDPTHFDLLLHHIENFVADAEEHYADSIHKSVLHNYSYRFPRETVGIVVERWLLAGPDSFRGYAITALRGMRLRRTVPYLVATFRNKTLPTGLRGHAIAAAGDIGGSAALQLIEGYRDESRTAPDPELAPFVLSAFGLIYAETSQVASSEEMEALHGIDTRSFLGFVLGCGFRRLHLDELKRFLESPGPSEVRGAAGISIARIDGDSAVPTLNRAAREENNPFARALFRVAISLASESTDIETLHRELCSLKDDTAKVWDWWFPIKREVIAALARFPNGRRHAEAWAKVMEVSVEDCLEEISEFNKSDPVALRSSYAAGSEVPTERDLIFVSYSHKDEKLCREFLTMLEPAAQVLRLHVWSDQQIVIGDKWHAEIEGALGRARVAVCMVTPDYLASRFVKESELPALLEGAKDGGVEIFWIACRPSTVQYSELAKYQAANDPNKPLSSLQRQAREKSIVNIVNKLMEKTNASRPAAITNKVL